jgi:hypothetical protein
MAAIQEYRELNPRGASERADRIHRGSTGAAGIQNVIDQNDSERFEIKRQTRFADTGERISNAEIVAMHRNIDHAQFWLSPFDYFNGIGQAPR